MRENGVPLTIALTGYDLAYEVTSGTVELAGVRPTFVDQPTPTSWEQFADTTDWDVADIPLAEYVSRTLDGDDRIVALPVFFSRTFPHRSIYARSDRISAPPELRGARIGTGSWSDTASIYVRGLLSDVHGVKPADATWVISEVGEATNTQRLRDRVPHLETTHRSLDELLLAGEVDAVIAPAGGPGVNSGATGGRVHRLFPNPGKDEREYFQTTKVFPIIRVLGIRREFVERNRWLATNVYRAFEVARRRYYSRLADIRASRVPIPSIAAHVEKLRTVLGYEIWPYGLEPNRSTLETFVRYSWEQGLIANAGVEVADLFASVEPFVDNM